MQEGIQLIQKYMKRWQLLRGLEALLYGFGAGLCSAFITRNPIIGVVAFIVVTAIAVLMIKPWRINVSTVSAYIDKHLDNAEYSSSLLLASPDGMSGLAQLQQQKITTLLSQQITTVKPKTRLRYAAITASALILIGVIVFYAFGKSINRTNGTTPQQEIMTFSVTDSVAPAYKPPVLINQKIAIRYPAYTKLGSRTSSLMNAKAVEGSQLYWQLDFDSKVSEVKVEGIGVNDKMRGDGTAFAKAYKPTQSGYYNFKFTDTLGASYASDIYAIDVVKDKAPLVEIKNIPQFTSFDYSDNKKLSFTAEISDDYGIAAAHIVATVSKGEGESVKFREEKLAFNQSVQVGEKSMRLSKNLNLDQLKMELGDELYFYVEVSDQKTPRPNITRSETFFAVINDTVSDGFGVEGTLGADLMPDYFRSQRQLIIDTEKLIEERPQLTEEEFKTRSNDLGFDQKALRLKYGQFMGDEADSGIAVTPEISHEDFDADDPTAGFRHDHDSENEHNLVPEEHDHEESDEEEGEKSILEGYVHNHDDSEESTLFTESLRGKLKQAMAEMWDAELYLRLADPKVSLPYQYRALTLIQDIKNSARIYVHRIGFDPPPIKEDKRLSGDLKEINNFYKTEQIAATNPYVSIEQSIALLEEHIAGQTALTASDKTILARAGEELAIIAIQEPARHLITLQQLKWLTEEKQQLATTLRQVQRGLLQALPVIDAMPISRKPYRGKLEDIFIKELQTGDR